MHGRASFKHLGEIPNHSSRPIVHRKKLAPQWDSGQENVLCALPNIWVPDGPDLRSRFLGKSFEQTIPLNLVEIDFDTCLSQRRWVSFRILMSIHIERQTDMGAETLDADFYRRRHDLCLELAAVVPTASPLFLRLSSLAQTYAEKAAAAAKFPETTPPSFQRLRNGTEGRRQSR